MQYRYLTMHMYRGISNNRDSLGVEPFYYTHKEGRLLCSRYSSFGSNIPWAPENHILEKAGVVEKFHPGDDLSEGLDPIAT